ncbi:heat shock protein 70-2 [Rhodocollybia butyracea]|uniref:Transcriptional coregulator SSA1 n=1 Tax=Rhodocollybia butyracea TaxID=206335 RepID=A0A9P5PZI2_9AGAR|nr:heat shock protein 70-2 [Rhodocollybia butyracea]
MQRRTQKRLPISKYTRKGSSPNQYRVRPGAYLSSFVLVLFVLLCVCPLAIHAYSEGSSSSNSNREVSGPVIGIDLGTTYSCVGISKGGRVEIIANDQGNRITPSWVSFNGDERLVGESAKRALSVNPKNTVFDVKRMIGRTMDDQDLQKDMKHWPFLVKKNSHGKPSVQVSHKGEVKDFTPEEISAMVLGNLKETAEAYLGQKVKHAVITVPAYFNDAQRQATKDAGTIAGLDVLRVLNEPTAAAIAYGLEKKYPADHEAKILVFDLGGGTHDVSLLSVEDQVFEVLATAGDTHLGGEDFDNRVMDFLVRAFKKKVGDEAKDIQKNDRAMGRLKKEVETAKRVLSSSQSAKIEIENFMNGVDFSETLTRAKFEELNGDLFRKTLKPVQQVLKDAGVRKEDIDEIVLVGGSTRIPKIQQLIRDFFGKEPSKGINPDEAVAYGAAVQAAILSGDGADYNTPLVIDINSLTLGIETSGGVFSKIIPRGTTLPTAKSQIFSTAADNQQVVSIKVFEGEREMTKDNHFLGQFELSGIPPAPRGVPQIEVTFQVDANGIMRVSAADKGTGRSEEITITSSRLSENDVVKMMKEAEEFAEQDKLQRNRVESLNSLSSFVYGLRDQLKETPNDKEEVVRAVEEGVAWIEQHGSDASVEDIEEKRAELEDMIKQSSENVEDDDWRHVEL